MKPLTVPVYFPANAKAGVMFRTNKIPGESDADYAAYVAPLLSLKMVHVPVEFISVLPSSAEGWLTILEYLHRLSRENKLLPQLNDKEERPKEADDTATKSKITLCPHCGDEAHGFACPRILEISYTTDGKTAAVKYHPEWLNYNLALAHPEGSPFYANAVSPYPGQYGSSTFFPAPPGSVQHGGVSVPRFEIEYPGPAESADYDPTAAAADRLRLDAAPRPHVFGG